MDAEAGTQVWRIQVGDVNRGETMTMAPLVVAAYLESMRTEREPDPPPAR